MTKVHSELDIGPEIGAGQHGKVHSGTCPTHGAVAVKIIRQMPGESAADWQQRKSALLKDGKHLAEATHNNVVRVFYVSESSSSDAIHLVMEYCDGGSLQKTFEEGPLSLTDALQLMHDVCIGLEALHTRGKLHRDIKPGNLLRIKQGKRTKIGDFGLVTDEMILGYAKRAGYQDHIAFEVWHGSGTSIRSDIWALGMTLYRILHGKEWYERSDRPQKVIKNGGFADSLRWLPHIPKSWRRFIRKMLHDDTKSRFQSANQVMSALAKLPNVPDFECEVGASEIEWTKNVRARRVRVVWRKLGKDQYEWEAWSEPPKGPGRNYTLGGSGRAVSHSESAKQLDRFFEKQ